MSDAVQALDLVALDRYLSAHLPGYQGPLSVRKYPHGQSNPTFEVSAPSGTYVLRRKPPGLLLKSAHAVDREFRVQRSLSGSAVPVAEMLCLCEDDAVIGSAFYVMRHVAGEVRFDPRLPDVPLGERSFYFKEMNRVLAEIHAVDIDAKGLRDFGAPGNYIARQVGRWSKQYRASETGEIADMNRLISALERHLAEGAGGGPSTLVHGDYRIDNIIYSPEGRILAVLDWELSTIGHPLADLASVIMQWSMPTGPEGRGLDGVDRASQGLPSDAEFVASYCERREIPSIEGFGFYLAFAFFRMGAVLQGVKKRALDGNASNPERALKLGLYVPVFAEKGLAALADMDAK